MTGSPGLRGLVIGLDGATFDLLEPMIRQGWLPNIQRALRQGAHGLLHSTIPPLTAPAWTSFQTGVNPGKHGVFSFQRRLDASLQREFINATAVRAPRFYHWLAQQGLTAASINVPISWPPQPMPPGDYLVTCMLTPSIESEFTSPPGLADELRAMGYVCDIRIKLHERDVRSVPGLTSVAQDLHQALLRREEAIFKLLAERPTDVLAVVFETPDRLQHYAWWAIEELLAGDSGLTRTPLHEAVETCYRELDRVVGRLLDEAATPETYVFFLSDHGFGPLQSRFHVDQWLAEHGWLAYAGGKATLRQRLRGPIQRIKRLLPKALLRRGRRALAVNQIINWQATQAYSGRAMEHAVYVNLQGREPQGTVPPEEFDALRRQIGEALLAVRDPRTGAAMVGAVYLREEIYHGPYVEEAPDLLFTLAPGYEPTSELSTQGIVSDARAEGAGIHQPDGIFIALGPGIRAGATLPGQNIEDVLPTLMCALGLPVSSAFDGRVIKAAFEPQHLATHPPIYTTDPGPDLAALGLAGPAAFSSEDAARVEERLAALGYLG